MKTGRLARKKKRKKKTGGAMANSSGPEKSLQHSAERLSQFPANFELHLYNKIFGFARK